MTRLPAIFISHGAPDLPLHPELPLYQFLSQLAETLPRPKGIVLISAHHQHQPVQLSAPENPSLIYDFYGFSKSLYQLQYPAQGANWLTALVAEQLDAAAIAMTTQARGYDHGAWVPLKIIYPAADIPVVQLSLHAQQGAGWHYRLGHALRALRDQGVLILGSGGASHNLRQLNASGGEPAPWTTQFNDWLNDNIGEQQHSQLIDYLQQAPYPQLNHPTDEHLLPLFVVLGTHHEGETIRRIHHSYQYQNLNLDAYGVGI